MNVLLEDEAEQEAVRKIIHIDMDCFYAAIEMRDFPGLANKPMAVGGLATQRGVISTSNYAARKFGVRSAMSTAKALKLCPHLIVRPGRMDVYKQESQYIRDRAKNINRSIAAKKLQSRSKPMRIMSLTL